MLSSRKNKHKVKLICLRHGETNYNVEGIVQGWSDSELSAFGIKQIEKYTKKIKRQPKVIFCSDLKRCRQTLEIIKKKFPLAPIFFDQRLRERYFGELENTNSASTDWKKFYAVPKDESIKGAETDSHFIERVRSFLSDLICKEHDEVLVVTSGGVISRIEGILEKPVTKHQNAKDYKFSLSRNDKRLKS